MVNSPLEGEMPRLLSVAEVKAEGCPLKLQDLKTKNHFSA